MKTSIKTILLALVAILTFSACSSDDEPEEVIYSYRVYSANLSAPDMNVVLRAYKQCFKDAKLSHINNNFIKGTKLEDILEACRQAEHGIHTSGMTFVGYYVFEVYSGTEVFYRSTWGTPVKNAYNSPKPLNGVVAYKSLDVSQTTVNTYRR